MTSVAARSVNERRAIACGTLAARAMDVELPPVPAEIRPGATFGELRLVERDDAPDGARLVLARGSARVVLRLRPWAVDRPSPFRRGGWAIDVLEPAELDARTRAAVGSLARALPEGHTRTGAAEPRAAPAVRVPRRAEGRAPVVCTAPWTTLEIVDPDGLARQCCADWTSGARGAVRGSSLLGVWWGAGYREARRAMASGAPGALCRPICPRLYDRKLSDDAFEVHAGSPAYVQNQLLVAEEIAEGRDEIRSKPLYVAVCASTYCNYDCIMCEHGRSPRRDLPEEIWGELAELLPTLRVLTLLGGEPLANPLAMRFLREFDKGAHPDAAVALVTNGSLLGEPTLRHLGGCRFASVTVSLNAGDAETYEKVQRGVPFDRVLANLDALLRFRAGDPRGFPVVLSFVAQPANIDTLPAFLDLARARELPVRLLPLAAGHVPELDFYGDPDRVARIAAVLEGEAERALRVRPADRAELLACREAILAEADARRARSGAKRLPLVTG